MVCYKTSIFTLELNVISYGVEGLLRLTGGKKKQIAHPKLSIVFCLTTLQRTKITSSSDTSNSSI